MAETMTAAKPKSAWGGGVSPFNVSWGKMFMWFFLVSDAFTFSSLIIAYGAMRHRFTDIWPLPGDVFTHFPFIHGHVPLAYVGLMTFILIMSSVTMVLAVEAGHRRYNKGVVIWLFLTIVGGLMFLGSQAWEWYHFIKGSEEGAYILADGRFARTDELEPGKLFIWKDHQKTIIEGAEAAQLKATAVKNIKGANLAENEYGSTPLFANFFFFITGFHGFHVFSGVVINIIILINVLNGVYIRRGHYEQVEKAGLYWHFVDLVWVFVFTFFYLV
jgi:cytochrome c oxidase subunit 3